MEGFKSIELGLLKFKVKFVSQTTEIDRKMELIVISIGGYFNHYNLLISNIFNILIGKTLNSFLEWDQLNMNSNYMGFTIDLMN